MNIARAIRALIVEMLLSLCIVLLLFGKQHNNATQEHFNFGYASFANSVCATVDGTVKTMGL